MIRDHALLGAHLSFLRWREGWPDGSARIVLIGLWALVFVVFTIRSFFLGLPHIGEQALIRVAMMAAGVLLCSLLYHLAGLLRSTPPVQAGAILLSALLASTVVYTFLNYALIYEISGLFRLSQPFSYVIAQYFSSFVWIFLLWSALCQFALSRAALSANILEEDRSDFSPSELWVRHRNGMVRIAVDDIRWVESEGDYVRLHLSGTSFLHRSTMAGMERRLADHSFVRIHRRALVRQREIKRLVAKGRRRFALLGDAVEVPIGQNYVAGLLNRHASLWR